MIKRNKVVAIGGGTGLYTLLRGLKEYDLSLTAIVAMTDDGGSTGELRDEYGVLPPGDVRRCIVALSESSELMKELFQYRFVRGSMAGHSFGNLFITALRELTNSDQEAIENAAKLLKVKGKVLPVTLEDRKLRAELENGQIIQGETNIDLPKHDGKMKIKKVFLNKPTHANILAVEAIRRADFIILGPGDLFTSIIPNLLVGGISKAISENKRAKKIYVCNLMTKLGETTDYQLHDFVNQIGYYLNNTELDYALWSPVNPSKAVRKSYLKQGSIPVAVDKSKLTKFEKTKFVRAPMASRTSIVRHDSSKLARLIWSLSNLQNNITFINE